MEVSVAAKNKARVFDNMLVINIRPKSKVISFKVDDITIYMLDKLANRLGISRSKLIRELVKVTSVAGNKVDDFSEIDRIEIHISIYITSGKAYSVSAKLVKDGVVIEK